MRLLRERRKCRNRPGIGSAIRGQAADAGLDEPGILGDRGAGSKPAGAGRPTGLIGLYRLERGDFELVHPRKVEETREDYEEGIELWKEGDPESARDALRYALSACHDNLWVHVALGRIALAEFRDPTLARGHFGYAFELGERALPAGFCGPAAAVSGRQIARFTRPSTVWSSVLKALGQQRDVREASRAALIGWREARILERSRARRDSEIRSVHDWRASSARGFFRL